MAKHMLKMGDISKKGVEKILSVAAAMKQDRSNPTFAGALKDKTLITIFGKPSLRTRVSLEVGMFEMGGKCLPYMLGDSPLGEKESVSDTAKVLSRMCHGVTARVASRSTMLELAGHASIPVVNALDDYAHPMQMLADLQTILEHKGTFDGITMMYAGDLENNVTYDLMRTAALMGFNLNLAGVGEIPDSVWEECKALQPIGSSIRVCSTAQLAAEGADVIYTDSWMSYGIANEALERRVKSFLPFQVTADIMRRAKPDCIFMNCLPAARGMEQTAEVIDGPQSVVFDQAENRLHAQKALLLRLMNPTGFAMVVSSLSALHHASVPLPTAGNKLWTGRFGALDPITEKFTGSMRLDQRMGASMSTPASIASSFTLGFAATPVPAPVAMAKQTLRESQILKQFVEDGEVVGICVSGGLDSKSVALRLRLAGVKVKCFTADIGQPDEEDINDVIRKMAPCGVETTIVDLKAEIAEGAFEAIACQATYDGGYWQSTGIGRYVTVRGLLKEMKKQGCTVFSHGATGKGNDQLRFERYTNVLDPSIKVYAPWRDATLLQEFPGRTEMLAFLHGHGIGHTIISQASKRYSTDSNACGLSNEAEDLESLQTPMTIVNPVMGVWPKDAPDAEEEVVLRFEKGRCVAVNGEAMSPLAVLTAANSIAGRNGIGLSHALENRVLGTKSRGVYEAPGMTLLGQGLAYVYQVVLDRRSSDLFKSLSEHVSNQLYDGRYFDPSTRAAIGSIWALAEPATGTVKMGLYKGSMYFTSITGCPHSMYFEQDSSMEATDPSQSLNPVSSQGFVEVCSVEAKSMAKAGIISKH